MVSPSDSFYSPVLATSNRRPALFTVHWTHHDIFAATMPRRCTWQSRSVCQIITEGAQVSEIKWDRP
jgi:hypothetical protein